MIFDTKTISKANLVRALDRGDVEAQSTDRHLKWLDNQVLEVTWTPREKTMSITGAAHLSASIKDKIAAAKARMANVTENTDLALAKLHTAADAADKVNKSIEAEADALTAELGQFTNGAPD